MKNFLCKNKKKVIVSMSGGVDSSVSAWLLQQQGYYVEGLFIKSWEEDDNEEYCISKKDLNDAQMVCDTLGIILHTVNFSTEYWDNVFSNFLFEYKRGRTPNPDVLCNKKIKFGISLKFAINDLGGDFIATGHYVRNIKNNGENYLLRGLDNDNDQSYFLYMLDHTQLVYCLFPVGEFTKTKIRNIASKLGLITAKKKSSTGICFIGKRKFKDFLRKYLPEKPGKIVSVEGKNVGYHCGLMYYTIGQRKGLCIGGIKNSNGYPWYVVDKNIKNNLLIVAQGLHNPSLMSNSFIVYKLYWINKKPISKIFCCTVKIRYRQLDIDCLIKIKSNKHLQVIFNKPVAAVTPGQSAVFYLGCRCLGGGIIVNR